MKKSSTMKGTHDEAIVASILTVEEAVAGLEEEQARLCVIVIGGDAKGSQALALSQQLLFSGVRSLVWCGLRGSTGIQIRCRALALIK